MFCDFCWNTIGSYFYFLYLFACHLRISSSRLLLTLHIQIFRPSRQLLDGGSLMPHFPLTFYRFTWYFGSWACRLLLRTPTLVDLFRGNFKVCSRDVKCLGQDMKQYYKRTSPNSSLVCGFSFRFSTCFLDDDPWNDCVVISASLVQPPISWLWLQ